MNIVYPSDYGIDLYADTLFTTEKMLKEKPDVVKKFVAATLKGWNAAIAAPEEAAKITVKYGDKLTYDHELAMMKASMPLLQARQQAGRLHGRGRLGAPRKSFCSPPASRNSQSTSPRPSPPKRCRLNALS